MTNLRRSPDAKTVLNAVIGYPLDHTLSPKLHNEIYQRMGLNAVMLAFSQKDLAAMIKIIRTLPIQLTAVTMPHKQAVLRFLDHVDAAARKIGAVNTVVNHKGRLYGFNTDVIGIAAALKNTHVRNKKVLLVGAGGVARPVAYYINQKHGKLMCLNRTIAKAKALVDQFGGVAITEKQFANEKIDLIINTTPIGMAPYENQSPIKSKFLNSSHTVFDMIYNPKETKLLRMAYARGAKIIYGMEVFKAQAIAQINLWNKFHY